MYTVVRMSGANKSQIQNIKLQVKPKHQIDKRATFAIFEFVICLELVIWDL